MYAMVKTASSICFSILKIINNPLNIKFLIRFSSLLIWMLPKPHVNSSPATLKLKKIRREFYCLISQMNFFSLYSWSFPAPKSGKQFYVFIYLHNNCAFAKLQIFSLFGKFYDIGSRVKNRFWEVWHLTENKWE